MQTTNVIEYNSGSILSLRSFEDNEEGNAAAEALFGKIASQNGADKLDIPAAIDEGLWEEGDYQVFIVHSSNQP